MKENLAIILMMSGMGAIGILTLVCGLAGIDLCGLGLLAVAGILTGLTGLLFSIFFIGNYILPRKEH